MLFQITPAGVVSTLHSFQGNPNAAGVPDGAGPGLLTLGNDGVIYGVTGSGGIDGAGTVFKF